MCSQREFEQKAPQLKSQKWNDVFMLSILVSDHSGIAWYLLGNEFFRGFNELNLNQSFKVI